MKVFTRLSVCSVMIGIIGSIYVVLCLGINDATVISKSENIMDMTYGFQYFLLSRSVALILLFLNGMCSFGWLTALPILFYRAYSSFFGLFSFFLLNGTEAADIPPLLFPFILEIIAMILFTPISTEFSLSLSGRSNTRFFKRFLSYILSFSISGVFVCLSACCDLIISKYFNSWV